MNLKKIYSFIAQKSALYVAHRLLAAKPALIIDGAFGARGAKNSRSVCIIFTQTTMNMLDELFSRCGSIKTVINRTDVKIGIFMNKIMIHYSL